MMANPEGTQQLRDRDLEFMFYDEAQVGALLLYCCCCGVGPVIYGEFSADLGGCRNRIRPYHRRGFLAITDFNLVVGPRNAVP